MDLPIIFISFQCKSFSSYKDLIRSAELSFAILSFHKCSLDSDFVMINFGIFSPDFIPFPPFGSEYYIINYS